MGHRANFVVSRGTDREIWYSQFGATSLPGDLLAGPDAFVAYVRSLERRDELLDSTWCEGAVALDLDARRLVFFENSGNHHFNRSPGLRRLYLPHLRRFWPGWDVQWARNGVLDVRRFLCLPLPAWTDTADADQPTRESLSQTIGIVGYVLNHPFRWAEYREGIEEASWFGQAPYQESLISLRLPDGTVRHVSGCPVSGLLDGGADLLDVLFDAEETPLPNELCAGAGAWIDVAAKRATAWWGGVIDDRLLQEVATRWPGWTWSMQDDGLPLQAEACGILRSAVELTRVNAARQMAEVLSFDQEQVRTMIGSHLARIRREGGSDVHVARTAMKPGRVAFDRASACAEVIAGILL